MPKIKVLYGERQNAVSGCELSPSAGKPKYFAELLQREFADRIEFIEPKPVSIDDIKRCHNGEYVDGIMDLSIANGFRTFSQSVVDSLPYTNGAMYDAAALAIKDNLPTAALVSGFHHAGYNGYSRFGHFCTFNGLMIAATKLVEDGFKKVAIIDCDMHYGNGTDDILQRLDPEAERYLHITFGRSYTRPSDADKYLAHFSHVHSMISLFQPSIILYQSGADVHVNDPYGGVLDEPQMYQRDVLMFNIAKDLNIPIAWNLAGGYQKDFDYVLKLHLNTFKACREVWER